MCADRNGGPPPATGAARRRPTRPSPLPRLPGDQKLSAICLSPADISQRRRPSRPLVSITPPKGINIWAFIGGFAEIFAGFGSGETAGTSAMFVLARLVSGAFGGVVSAPPGIGGGTLALLFGLFSLIYGISQIVTGTQLHRIGRTLEDAA